MQDPGRKKREQAERERREKEERDRRRRDDDSMPTSIPPYFDIGSAGGSDTSGSCGGSDSGGGGDCS